VDQRKEIIASSVTRSLRESYRSGIGLLKNLQGGAGRKRKAQKAGHAGVPSPATPEKRRLRLLAEDFRSRHPLGSIPTHNRTARRPIRFWKLYGKKCNCALQQSIGPAKSLAESRRNSRRQRRRRTVARPLRDVRRCTSASTTTSPDTFCVPRRFETALCYFLRCCGTGASFAPFPGFTPLLSQNRYVM